MVRRIGYVLALAAFAAAGWAAAPALSLNPYLPVAEDFEQKLPDVNRVTGLAAEGLLKGDGHDHGDDGPITHWTEVIEAPHRFDLVGLAGELRAVEFRARAEGGEWSEWVPSADGNPVYFGGADELQLRTRGWRPSGRLHYVNVSGTTTAGKGVLNGVRRAINGAFISAVSVVQPTADAAGPRPGFISRNQWGANRQTGGCPPRRDPFRPGARGEVRAAAIHHTVTGNGYTRAEAPGIVLGICRYHRNANGWDDIGYNALVDRFGRIYVGRAGGIARPIIGAHAQGVNAQTTGVAAIGTHTQRRIGPRAVRAFGRFLAWKLPHHGLPIRGQTQLESAGGSVSRFSAGQSVTVRRVFPHRRVNYTACPGDQGRSQIPAIRQRAHTRMVNHR